MKHIRLLLFTAIVAGFANSCKKPAEGFISGNIFYRANPFNANQGFVSYSAPLDVDGSTAPLNVKLLDVRNKATGQSVKDSLLKEREVTTFVGEVTLNDTTVAQLANRITKSMKRALYINPIGGRIEMTSATALVEATTYEIDIEVSNIRGTKIIKNACDIVVKPSSTPYTIIYQRIRKYNPDDTNPEVVSDNAAGYPINIKFTPGGTNKIILKWVDKNNKPFNPKTDITRWNASLPAFRDWNPFYPEVLTDSTIEFQYPVTGLTFPIHSTTKLGFDNGLSYYRFFAASNDQNKNLQSTSAIRYHANGRYEVTYHINFLSKK